VIRISGILSARQGEVSAAVEKLMGESESQKAQMNQLYQKIFKMRCKQLPSCREPLLIFEEQLPPARLRQLCTLLCQEEKGDLVLVCSGEAGQFYYVLGSREEKVDTVVRKLNGLLNGKGSGKGLMAQGMFSSAEDEIRRVWEEGLWKE